MNNRQLVDTKPKEKPKAPSKMPAMEQDVALHFRDQLRAARAAVLRDAEAFQEIAFVFERLGAYLSKEQGNLGSYSTWITNQAAHSPMANEVPEDLPNFHQHFDVKYDIVRDARNSALHEGALARHLTANAVELSLVLEEAIMSERHQVSDFMVRNPVCAFMWQPLSFIRQTMLVNSFSYLPVPIATGGKTDWRLISDFRLGRYLRKNGKIDKTGLIQRLQDTVESGKIELHMAKTCSPQDKIEARRVSTTLRQVLTKFSEFSVFTKKFRARMTQERRSPTRSTHSISGFAFLQAHFLFPKYIAVGI